MKRITGHLLITACIGMFMTGCAANPFFGLAVTKVHAPTINLTTPVNATASTKVGEAYCKNFLGLVALGDASLDAAMKNGGITRIHHVDCKYEVYLGVYSKFTIIAYGE
jgi:hypothetical protein